MWDGVSPVRLTLLLCVTRLTPLESDNVDTWGLAEPRAGPALL